MDEAGECIYTQVFVHYNHVVYHQLEASSMHHTVFVDSGNHG